MVYVGTREYRYGRMIMSHMVADDIEELHEMANRLGVRRWFQNKGKYPHYDISKVTKKKAIELGVKMVNDRELIQILNSITSNKHGI